MSPVMRFLEPALPSPDNALSGRVEPIPAPDKHFVLKTPLTPPWPEGMEEAQLGTEIEATLVKRSGTPEDVVRAVLFLVQSPYVTGETVVVDGGATVAGGSSRRSG